MLHMLASYNEVPEATDTGPRLEHHQSIKAHKASVQCIGTPSLGSELN